MESNARHKEREMTQEEDSTNSYRSIAQRLLHAHKEKFGQAFERFYRPEIIRREGSPLERLAEEPLALVQGSDTGGLSDPEFKSSLKINANQLAEKLYHLAANAWDRNINTYLKAFDNYLEEYTCEEQRIFLEELVSAFKKQYSAELLERGESIELIDQIVKRTGESTRTRLEKVLAGANITELTKEIWELFFSADSGSKGEIERILLDLTNHQIRELRVAFADYPALLLANVLKENLPEISIESDEEHEPKKQDTENKKEKKVVNQFKLEALRYLLRGRAPYEIKRIETAYNDVVKSEKEPDLLEHITRAFPLQLHNELLGLLEGENLKDSAARIIKLFTEYQQSPPKPTPLPPRISENLPTITPEYTSFFWRRRLFHESSTAFDYELEGFQEILAEVGLLSPFLLERLDAMIREASDLSLSLRLYPRGRADSPARTAERLRDAISNSESSRCALSHIYGYTPGEMARVRKAYATRYGVSLEEDLTPYLSGDTFQERLIKAQASGLLRAQFHVDLLSIFLPAEKHPAGSALTTTPFEERLHQTAVFLQQEKIETFDELRERLKQIAPSKLYMLEAEFELTTEQSLRRLLPVFSSKDKKKALALFNGTDVQVVTAAMVENMEDALEKYWIGLSNQEIEVIDESFSHGAKRSLLTVLLEKLTIAGTNVALIQEALIQLLSVEAIQIREELRAINLKQEGASTEPARCIMELPYPALRFLEHAYSQRYGSLRRHLLSLVSGGFITEEWFGKLIYRLEGIDSAIIDEIEIGLSENDSKKLRMIFLELGYQCRTVEEVFLLENQNESIKTAIMGMSGAEDERAESVLYFLGYYPDKVAKFVEEALAENEVSVRTKRLQEIFRDPLNPASPNPLLPGDLNWINEMYIQVRRRFFLQTGGFLMPQLLDSGIPLELSTSLKLQLFSSDTSLIVDEIADTISNQDADEALAQYLCSRLKDSPPRYIRGIRELFSCLYPKESLEERLKKSPSSKAKKALEVLLRSGSYQ